MEDERFSQDTDAVVHENTLEWQSKYKHARDAVKVQLDFCRIDTGYSSVYEFNTQWSYVCWRVTGSSSACSAYVGGYSACFTASMYYGVRFMPHDFQSIATPYLARVYLTKAQLDTSTRSVVNLLSSQLDIFSLDILSEASIKLYGD